MTNYPKAIKVTKAQVLHIIRTPGEKEVYRQTRNWNSNTWMCPKALWSSGRWRVIRNRQLVIRSGKQGNNYALWRMYERKAKAMEHSRKKWDCNIYVVITQPFHSIYYLVCKKIHYSIQGTY